MKNYRIIEKKYYLHTQFEIQYKTWFGWMPVYPYNYYYILVDAEKALRQFSTKPIVKIHNFKP